MSGMTALELAAQLSRYADPLLKQAAAELERLAAENDRLRRQEDLAKRVESAAHAAVGHLAGLYASQQRVAEAHAIIAASTK